MIKTIKELAVAAEAYSAARKSATEFKKVQDEYAALLKEYLAEKELQSIVAGGFKLTLSEVLSEKFDLKKFKHDHPRIKFDAYETAVTISRLGVKAV